MSATKRPSAVDGMRRGVGTIQGKPAAPENPPAAPAAAVPPPRPEKPVRFTLDLDPDLHAFLKTFALECGAGIGGATVMRALLGELRDSAYLNTQIKRRIWDAGK